MTLLSSPRIIQMIYSAMHYINSLSDSWHDLSLYGVSGSREAARSLICSYAKQFALIKSLRHLFCDVQINLHNPQVLSFNLTIRCVSCLDTRRKLSSGRWTFLIITQNYFGVKRYTNPLLLKKHKKFRLSKKKTWSDFWEAFKIYDNMGNVIISIWIKNILTLFKNIVLFYFWDKIEIKAISLYTYIRYL